MNTSSKVSTLKEVGETTPILSSIRIFEFSSDTFGVFRVFVNMDKMSSNTDILDYCVLNLLKTLSKYNLVQLVSIAKLRRFHMHNESFQKIKNSEPNQVFYICDHC